MARLDPKINIRLPADLLQRLAVEATANKRSTTAEIVARLEASGKTLRDEFAMAALTGITSRFGQSPDLHAQDAFEIADAMLAERQKGGA